MDDPQPVARCLGCNHIRKEVVLPCGRKATACEWEMSDSLRSAVEKYVRLSHESGFTPKLTKVATPFIDTQTVDPDEDLETGTLGSVAASILMQVLYVARLARLDLLKAIAMLASKILKWTRLATSS